MRKKIYYLAAVYPVDYTNGFLWSLYRDAQYYVYWVYYYLRGFYARDQLITADLSPRSV